MADPLILALETATACASVALTRGGRAGGQLLAEYSLMPGRSHSRHLLGMAEAIMQACAVDWGDLDAVAVSCGPGSFTGLRVGLAAAKGLAFATGKQLVPVPTLDALAAQMPPVDMPVCALLDARKAQVYAALYHPAGVDAAGLPERLGPYRACAAAALPAEFRKVTLCIGPGLAACDADFLRHPLVRALPALCGQPRAALVGCCAADMLQRGLAPHDCAPLYLRASQAELGLGERVGETA